VHILGATLLYSPLLASTTGLQLFDLRRQVCCQGLADNRWRLIKINSPLLAQYVQLTLEELHQVRAPDALTLR
jgi:hypothetical protein